jgi:hypothetical protein
MKNKNSQNQARLIFFVDLNLLVFLIGILNEQLLHSNDNTLHMSLIKN